MAITHIQGDQGHPNAAGVTSASVSLTGVTAGNLIVVLVSWYANDRTPTVSDGTSSLTAGTKISVGGYTYQQPFYLLSANSGSRTYTVTFGGAVDWPCVTAMEFSGGSFTFNTQNTGSGTSSSAASGAISTPAGDIVAIAGEYNQDQRTTSTQQIGGTAATVPSYNEKYAEKQAVWYRIMTASMSSGTATATLSGSSQWVCNVIAFSVQPRLNLAESLVLAESLTIEGTTPPSLEFQQSKGLASAGSSGTIAQTFDSAVLSGSLIVAVVSCVDVSGITTATCADSLGSSYTLGVGPTRNADLNGTGYAQWIFYKESSPAGTDTVTATFSTSVTDRRIDILEYSGVALVSSVTGTPVGATGSTGAPNSGNTTITVNDALIFGGGLHDGGNLTAGATFTQRVRADGYDCTEDRIVSSSGSYAAVFSTGTYDWIAQVIAFRSSLTGVYVPVAESLSVAEVLTVRIGTVLVSGSDALSLSDSLTVSPSTSVVQLALEELLILTDFAYLGGVCWLFPADDLALVDSVTIFRDGEDVLPQDNLSLTEALTIICAEWGLAFSDAVDLSDAAEVAVSGITFGVSHGAGFDDALTVLRPDLTLEVSESIGLSDTPLLAYGTLTLSFEESLGLADSLLASPSGFVIISVMDMASFADSMQRSTTKQINSLFCFSSLTGSSASLDALDGNALMDGDRAWVLASGVSYWYYLDEDSGVVESSPSIIAPNTNAGAKRWRRCV